MATPICRLKITYGAFKMPPKNSVLRFGFQSTILGVAIKNLSKSTPPTIFACTMGDNCSVEGCKIKAMKHGRGLCYIHGENK
jgi:hypothetical protein